nr:bargin-like [Cherax quadricarinatus]
MSSEVINISRHLKYLKNLSDRTDVVGELRTAEEQVEELRLLCEAYTRSLEKCLHTHTTADEKKLRKVPEYQAAETLKETLSCLPPVENPEHQDLLRSVVARVVEVQQAMGLDVVEYEDALDKQILGPLAHLIKDEFPSIAKQKKQLKQVGLDLDAAKTRWRNSQANPSPNAKMDTYREELEEAEAKLDQARDTYACDIFSLMAREREISQYMCGYLELQREFMQKTLTKLDRVLPDMRQQLEASSSSPAFGVPLRDHLKIVQQEIAVPLQVCVRRLVEIGLFEEGLFRVAGSTSKVRRLKGAFDANLVTNEALAQVDEHDRDYDVHVVAGTLKCYLRELPEPLLTHFLHDQWLEAVRQTDHQLRLKALWLVVNQLPPANLANLRYLVKFLAKLAANSSCNKMSPSNIAIVMAPNLIWDQRDSEEQPDMSTLGRNMSLTSDYRSIVDHLVEYSDYFFKEDIDFGVIPRVPPSPSRLHTEPNGSLPLPAQHGRPAPQTHRRNASSDLSSRIDSMSASLIVAPTTSDSCESPKQPQRTKKKQAPRPPQARPSSTHGSFGIGSQDGQISGGSTNSASGSPEQARSNTPPRETMSQILVPAPAARLHHSNSIRRPTAEPPKPPGAPTKPPRPSPPTVEHLERSAIAQQYSEYKTETKVVPLGFEQIHTCKETDINCDESEVVLRKKDTGEGPGPIGFIVDGKMEREDGDSSRSFRKSLESVLQHQAAGQPVALPRHSSSSSVSSDGETIPAGAIPLPRLASAGESTLRPVIPPTPVQRTTIPSIPVAQTAQRITRDSTQTIAPDRPEPIVRLMPSNVVKV